MRVVEQLLRRADRAPGKAAFLGAVIDLLGGQAGDKAGDQTIDDVRGVGVNYRLVLILRVAQVASHPVGVEQVSQFLYVFGIEAAADQRANVIAVTGTELGARAGSRGMVTTGVTLQHLAAIDVVGDRRFRGQRAGLVDRRIDVLAARR